MKKKNQRQLSLAHSLTLSLSRSLTHSLRRCVYILPDSFSRQQERLAVIVRTPIWYVTLHFTNWRGAASFRPPGGGGYSLIRA